MSNKMPAPILRVPYTITDKQLIETLKKVLPDLLVKKMNIDRVRAEQVAESMAAKIVDTARRCNETHLISDISNKIDLNAPSQEECNDFKKAVDELIKIRYVEKIRKRTSGDMFKTVTGKLFFWLKHRVLGHPLEFKDEHTGTWAGPRG